MEELPAELTDHIVEHCDHSSLKTLRGVNKYFHKACTTRVFEHYYIGYFRESLEKLQALSNSELAKHVKKFTLYSDILPDWDRNEWETHIDFRPDLKSWSRSRWLERVEVNGGNDVLRVVRGPPKCGRQRSEDEYEKLPRHSFTESELENGWRVFSTLQNNQRTGQSHQSLFFREHFARFPNLVEAEVTTATPFQGRISKWPVWKRLRQQMFVSPDDWVYGIDYAENESRARLSGQAALCLLEAIGFRASFAGTNQIRSLTVNAAHSGPFKKLMGKGMYLRYRGHDDENFDFDSRLDRLREGFKHLTEISLHVPHAAESDYIGGEATAAELCQLLHSARELKKLHIMYNDDDTGMSYLPQPAVPSLTPLFQTPPDWKRLEHLSLSADMPYTLLLSFFERYAPTLRSLELRDMVVDDAKELLARIPSVLNLEHVYIECLWHFDASAADGPDAEPNRCFFDVGSNADEPWERAMKAYLLGQRQKPPDHRYLPAVSVDVRSELAVEPEGDGQAISGNGSTLDPGATE